MKAAGDDFTGRDRGKRRRGRLVLAGTLLALWVATIYLSWQSTGPPPEKRRAAAEEPGRTGEGAADGQAVGTERGKVGERPLPSAKKGRQRAALWTVPFDRNGEINPVLLEEAKIAPGQVEELRGIVKKHWEWLSKDLDLRLKPVAEESNAAEGVAVYRAEANPELAESRIVRLRSDLEAVFGEETAGLLTSYLSSTAFGAFGAREVKVTITQHRGADGQPDPASREWKVELPAERDWESMEIRDTGADSTAYGYFGTGLDGK